MLHDLTGGWTVPLVALLAACASRSWWLGLTVARPAYVEDELDPQRSTAWLKEPQTTLSGSSCSDPSGPIWMSVPISGQTPQS